MKMENTNLVQMIEGQKNLQKTQQGDLIEGIVLIHVEVLIEKKEVDDTLVKDLEDIQDPILENDLEDVQDHVLGIERDRDLVLEVEGTGTDIVEKQIGKCK